MRFPYSVNIGPAETGDAVSGDAIAILRPEVLVLIHGPTGAESHYALVDTGADNTILPSSVAERLGISMTNCRGPEARAFGGQKIALTYADIVLELTDDNSCIRWQARAFFAESASESEDMVILGHQGFLDFFTATFDGEDCSVSVEPNSTLPTVN